MSEKIREFFQLVHTMNHGDLRQIARAITDQIADRERAEEFDASDYRDFCDVLFDCALRELGQDAFAEAEEDDTDIPAEPVDELPRRSFVEPDTGPVSAFARKGA